MFTKINIKPQIFVIFNTAYLKNWDRLRCSTYVFVLRTSSQRLLVEPLNISNESLQSSSSGSLVRGQTKESNIILKVEVSPRLWSGKILQSVTLYSRLVSLQSGSILLAYMYLLTLHWKFLCGIFSFFLFGKFFGY